MSVQKISIGTVIITSDVISARFKQCDFSMPAHPMDVVHGQADIKKILLFLNFKLFFFKMAKISIFVAIKNGERSRETNENF